MQDVHVCKLFHKNKIFSTILKTRIKLFKNIKLNIEVKNMIQTTIFSQNNHHIHGLEAAY